jgi:ABC-2 type transport system permease protein
VSLLTAPESAALAQRQPAFRDVPAYRQIIHARIRTSLMYRQNAFLLLAVAIVQIFILRKVWTALYRGQGSVDGLTIHAMIVYLSIACLQNWVMQDPTVPLYMYERIREGKVAFDLIRPVGFIPQMFAQLAGSAVGAVMFTACALPIVAFAGALSLPASARAGGLYVVSLLAGYTVTMMLTLILGLIAFWTLEISGLTMLYILVGQFFAGALVPIPFFPGPLRVIADLLPFQATTYTPVAIYVGRLTGTPALQAIAVQLAWTAVLGLVAKAIWSRTLHRVVVQGG